MLLSLDDPVLALRAPEIRALSHTLYGELPHLQCSCNAAWGSASAAAVHSGRRRAAQADAQAHGTPVRRLRADPAACGRERHTSLARAPLLCTSCPSSERSVWNGQYSAALLRDYLQWEGRSEAAERLQRDPQLAQYRSFDPDDDVEYRSLSELLEAQVRSQGCLHGWVVSVGGAQASTRQARHWGEEMAPQAAARCATGRAKRAAPAPPACAAFYPCTHAPLPPTCLQPDAPPDQIIGPIVTGFESMMRQCEWLGRCSLLRTPGATAVLVAAARP